MKQNITIKFRNDRYSAVTIETPSQCPHCGRTMSPALVGKSDSSDIYPDDNARFSVVFRCAFEDCQKYFAIEYVANSGKLTTPIDYAYRPPIKIKLPDNIEKVSKDFVEIYSQATVAESERLDQIAGVGYRKAAEFLIKDYVISKNPDNSEQIKKIMLGKVIDDYLTDFPKIQNLAKAVAWIGNDETHYIRRHDDKDVQDLKKFIFASAQFIAADYDADEALSFTTPSS